jgi:hypothetical protein
LKKSSDVKLLKLNLRLFLEAMRDEYCPGRRRKNLRLNGLPPWDIVGSASISVLALFFVHLSPPSMRGLSTILGIVLAIPLLGHLLVLSLFPSHGGLGLRTRALLSLGVSTFLIAVVSLILIPGGLQLTYVATILSLLMLFLAAFAYVRWSALPRRRRFILWSLMGRRSRRSPASSILVDIGERVVSLLSNFGSLRNIHHNVGASTFLAVFAYFRWTSPPRRNRLAIWLMKSSRSWRSSARSLPACTKGQFVCLLFVLVIICAFAVPMFTSNADKTPSNDKVKNGESTSYREDHLWTNSYNIKSNKLDNSSHINASARSTRTIAEQKSNVTAMKMNNGSSNGNSTPSGEKPSLHEPSEKIRDRKSVV